MPPETQLWVYGFFAALILGFLPTVKAILDIWDRLRGFFGKKEPATDGEKYVTRSELKEHRDAVDKDLRRVEQTMQRTEAAIFRELTELKASVNGVNTSVQTLSRDLAKLAANLAHVEGALGE